MGLCGLDTRNLYVVIYMPFFFCVYNFYHFVCVVKKSLVYTGINIQGTLDSFVRKVTRQKQ